MPGTNYTAGAAQRRAGRTAGMGDNWQPMSVSPSVPQTTTPAAPSSRGRGPLAGLAPGKYSWGGLVRAIMTKRNPGVY